MLDFKMTNIKVGIEEISEQKILEVLKNNCSVVSFFNEWNMSCLMTSAIIEELAEKFNGKINFARINIEENASLQKKFNVLKVPTIIVFKNGSETARLTGQFTEEQIEEKLEGFLK